MAEVVIACCVPKQYHTREDKLAWLRNAVLKTKCDLFLTPQEYFGGHVAMPQDLHIEHEWLVREIGGLAKEVEQAIGVGAAVKHPTGGATEDYMYFGRDGRLCGHHRKFALPAYDDVRANGAGQLWPEAVYANRIRPVDIKELGLRIGTVFCWEVFSLTMFPAYSFAGVNLIVHPIKFAPKGWPKLSPAGDGIRRVVGFGYEAKGSLWRDKLVMASAHEVFCPIAISCNSWSIGEKYMAMTGHVDEVQGTTEILELPSTDETDYIHVFSCNPSFYTGIDFTHNMGAFKEHTGTVEGFHKWSPWTMHKKMRRIEAQLIGGTARLDCMLKASTESRQKKSVFKRAQKVVDNG